MFGSSVFGPSIPTSARPSRSCSLSRLALRTPYRTATPSNHCWLQKERSKTCHQITSIGVRAPPSCYTRASTCLPAILYSMKSSQKLSLYAQVPTAQDVSEVVSTLRLAFCPAVLRLGHVQAVEESHTVAILFSRFRSTARGKILP